MVSPDAVRAIADVIGEAILLPSAGETFVLGRTAICVRRIARAITMAVPGETLRRTTTGACPYVQPGAILAPARQLLPYAAQATATRPQPEAPRPPDGTGYRAPAIMAAFDLTVALP